MPGGSGMGIGKIDYLGESSKSVRSARPTFQRIAQYFRPYRPLLALIFLCLLLGALAGQITPLVMRAILDKALPRRDGRLLLALVAALVAFPILEGLATVAQQYLNALITQNVMRDMRVQLFRHLNRMSLRFFTATRTGEIISRLNNDVNGVQDVISKIFVNAANNGLTLVVTVTVMLSLDVTMTLISLAVLPLFVLPVRRVGRFRQKMRRRAQEHYAELNHRLQESFGISGAILMRVFGHERIEEARLASAADRVRQLEVKISVSGRWFAMLVTLASPLGAALLFWYGGLAVMRGVLSVGTVVAFTVYLGRLYSPFSQLINLHIDLLTAAALFERVFEYLDLKPEINDRPGAHTLTSVAGHVRFERVSFAYQDGEPVLHDVSFEARPGESVALVGPSGGGKTTLAYLLLRFYDPADGHILLDGQDLRDVTVRSLRAQIGVATQEPFLFHATVRENLLYARADASTDDLTAACQAAYIHDRIRALPEGYDTVVGERGYKLSGGEKQRLALARVFLKDPRLLILDEATSSVDSPSEAFIQSALERLRRGRTTLIIAHRLSTVQTADKIVVLQTGRVVEQGTHAELLAHGGLYAQLYPKG